MNRFQALRFKAALALGLAGATLSAGCGGSKAVEAQAAAARAAARPNWGSEGDKALWGTIEVRVTGAP